MFCVLCDCKIISKALIISHSYTAAFTVYNIIPIMYFVSLSL